MIAALRGSTADSRRPDLLTAEQSLVAIDAQVASFHAQLIGLQIDVFKALGGGWASR